MSCRLFGEVIMRKICRSLALRTRSDERALIYGIIAVSLSVLVAAVLGQMVS